MADTPDITAVICTYNRCELLHGAIERMIRQDVGTLRYELIVVDNNSSDGTKLVVDSFIQKGHDQIRYVFEGKQGLSHARNAAIAHARAPLVAFTDDDIRVASEWLVSIVRAFERHPEAMFLGGKVLPEWTRKPPAWLTKEHWAPLAILDRGEEPAILDGNKAEAMVGANLAVRREVFERVGNFLPKFQRVKDGIGSTEDHDFQLRLHQAGLLGLYAPEAVVFAAVQEDRLSKSYHRRWHAGHGRFSALMGIEPVPNDALCLRGVPAYLYGKLLRAIGQWFWASLCRRQSETLRFESRILYLVNYLRVLFAQASKQRERSFANELFTFAISLIRRKLRI